MSILISLGGSMFYISHVDSKNNIFGVMDTKDNKEEFYTREQLIDIVTKTKVRVLGVTKVFSGRYYIESCTYKGLEYRIYNIEGTNLHIEVRHVIDVGGIKKTALENRLVMTEPELLSLKLRTGANIVGFKAYQKNKINDGDIVVYGKYCGKDFIVKKSVLTYNKYGRLELGTIDTYRVMQFASTKELLNYCDKHTLTIDNMLPTNSGASYWMRSNDNDGLFIDLFLRKDDVLLSLGNHLVGEICNAIDRYVGYYVLGKEICTLEYGYCSYNMKDKYFHYSNYSESFMISFKLSTTAPQDQEMLCSELNHKNFLDNYGVCVSKVKIEPIKKNKGDIVFYTK